MSMKYSITQNALNSHQLIQKVYKIIDSQNHIRIKWDCIKEDEYNLIVVIRSLKESFEISQIEAESGVQEGTNVFVYSRRDTEGHIESRRQNIDYFYYIYPGKLSGKGEIEIYDQRDGNNIITDQAKTISGSKYVKPEGKLHYEWLLPIPLSGWNKRACLNIIGKSQYSDHDIIHYTVSGRKERFCIRLTDTGNEIYIPLRYGETVSFSELEVDLEEMNFGQWISWKVFKHRRGD